LLKSYASSKWNIRQILNHLADAESVLYDRIRRVISEPKQVIWAFDPDAWCIKLDYNTFPLAINKTIFLSIREGVIHLANKYYDSLGKNEFIHSVTGVRTLQDEFEKVALHNETHLEQIKKALLLK